MAGHDAKTTRGVIRHRESVDDADVVWHRGLLVTSFERTVFDIIRLAPLETAVAAADAWLRDVAWDAREHACDPDAEGAARERMRERCARATGARGVRQARWITEFADGRAQLPGESVSRLYLFQLGFAAPRLQVEVRGPNGERWFLDFGLDDVRSWGEFDGESKYTDPAFLRGRTPEQVLLDEKRREDWIRGTTDRRFPWWGMQHLGDAGSLGSRLVAFGIRPPR